MADPFACFGDSDSSADEDEDENDNTTNNDGDINLHLVEGKRLKEKVNAEKAIITPVEGNFVVFDAPNAGKAIRATKSYKCGDLIMRESAAMRIPNSQPASSLEAAEDMHKRACQRAYNSMHETTQRALMDLSSCKEDETAKTPRGVYDTNAFRLGNEDLGGLFLTLARMNHSCRPNVNHYWREELQQTLVFASRDIEAGEEMNTLYGPSTWMDTERRREYLHERFAFWCRCSMCVEGNEGGGDDRMERIQALQEDIALLSSLTVGQSNAGVTLESIEKCLALMKEQGLG